MKRETFVKLCHDLSPGLEGQATLKDANVIIGRKTSCCPLYFLADERRVRKLANAFGIGKSTVLKVVRRVTTAISRLLGSPYIKHP